MFRALLSDVKLFNAIVKSLNIIDEGTFIASPELLKLSEMDPAKVALVMLELPSTVFDEYECSNEVRFRLDMDELRKVSRRASSKDSIEILLDEKENRFHLRFVGRIVRTFTLSLREMESGETRVPQIPFKAMIKMLPDIMKQVIMDAKVVSDALEISADEMKLTFSASSNIGEVKHELGKDDENILEYNVEEPSRALYPINYLEDMISATPAADIVTISFSTNMPMRIDYAIPGGGKIIYYLAPRREA
ncbi:MAG: proliferating cell nuclear antigen (pcna) [Candidatus Asgardarchaeia archaeon]